MSKGENSLSFLFRHGRGTVAILPNSFNQLNIYPSMKGEWIKSSLIIIAFMQVFPIFLCFLDTSIRFISFKCKSERLFRLSSILL